MGQFFQNMFIVTPFYAALAAFFFLFLSVRVIKIRRTRKVALGDGENRELRRAMRVHANFVEYVPFTLLLMGAAELSAANHWALHGTGVALLAGRVVHLVGFGREPENFKLRQAGMWLTFYALASAAVQNAAALISVWMR